MNNSLTHRSVWRLATRKIKASLEACSIKNFKMKPSNKQGKLGLFLFVCLTLFSMSLFLAIIDPSIGTVLVSISLFFTSVAIFLTVYSKDKKQL